jgi:hypothetical protein
MRPLYDIDTELDDEFILEAEHHKMADSVRSSTEQLYESESQDELEEFIKDLSKAVQLNYYYGAKLGWNQYYAQINELLLPHSGMKNVTLGPEAFAQAVAEWQKAQGFSETDSDGILGPQTWGVMEPKLKKGSYVPYPTIPVTGGGTPPPISDIAAFNAWHARQIVDAMDSGLFGTNFDSKTQLTNLANGVQVKNVNPKTRIVQVLPIIYHIMQNAKAENFRDIIIGSFIRDQSGKSCTGHCEGRCIDINYKGGSFETSGSVTMVKNILRYLLTVPAPYKKSTGFGMPMQGQFFGSDGQTLKDADLRTLVPQLGYVFLDNPNHLHIQVRWV